jgi:hypothetical protein
MILYHVTHREDAVMIQAGFQDAPTPHGMGVWLAEHPLEIQDGSSGDTVLEVVLDMPGEALRQYEWDDPLIGCRQWVVPAVVVNACGKVRLLEQDEATEGEIQEALARIRATFLADGMVGEQLEEAMRREEEYLRRWEPPLE